MKLYKINDTAILQKGDRWFQSSPLESWHQLINRNNLYQHLDEMSSQWNQLEEVPFGQDTPIQAPVDPNQEVWAAGVTYLRSKVARMEESQQSGGAVFYDLVYDAERPELFFKSMGYRVRGHQEAIHIRPDSQWDVPEPELTLFITSDQKIVAYTIGNDVSSRSIEGENPLYLPQAKVFDGSAAVGPCLWVPREAIPSDSVIRIGIIRDGEAVYQDEVKISQMKRRHDELAEFLFRAQSFEKGAFLMTGTCLVPDNDFTLKENDTVRISIDPVGILINHVKNKIK